MSSSVRQSIVTVGAAVGGLLGGWMVDRVGRKLSLMFCSLPFVFGFTVIVAAQNRWMLYGGRALTGLASGVTSLVVPVGSGRASGLGHGLYSSNEPVSGTAVHL